MFNKSFELEKSVVIDICKWQFKVNKDLRVYN